MTKRKPASAGPAFTLSFPQLDREIPSHDGETIYQSARRSGVRIIGACGGRGTCGTCRVLIVEGEIDKFRNTRLNELLAGRKIRQKFPFHRCT